MTVGNGKEEKSAWRQAALVGSSGVEFAAAVGLGAWLGSLADARLATAPWLTLLGFLFGLAVGISMFRNMLRRLEHLQSGPPDDSKD